MANGSRHTVYVVAEDTYGVTPDTPAFDTMRSTGITLGLSKDSLQSEEIRNDRQIADYRLGANQVGGDLKFELSAQTYDALFESAFQSTWETGVPAGKDRLACGTTRKSFTIMRHFGDLTETDPTSKPYFVYRGCEVNTMSLTINANSMIPGVFGFVGKGLELLPTTIADSYNDPTETSTLDSFTGELKANGTTIAVITEIGLSLENGISPRFVVSSRDSILPEVGDSNLTGTMTAYFESSSLVEQFINETETRLEVSLPDKDGNTIELVVPRIKYTGGQPDVDGPGSVMLSLPFQALFDTTEQTNLVMYRNTQA
ncbi:major tail protein [Vibrio phage 2.117.O._10N.261.45.E9]|nr:major tail protein [Vibrio phage 1.117.O._10N.261.45.E9]AUR95438.1 major tail protein [Vibrio phage 1.207.B._10N.222.51.C2]AUS02329.1 major tail protein [Vibrio phage 2.117.O._10N.261.45.E9]